MQKENYLKIFLILYLIGSVIVFIIQFFFSEKVALLSLFESSLGWQQEIALWNLGIIFAIIYALKKNNKDILKFLILTLSFISLILGTNHFLTMFIYSKILLINELGFIFNYLALIFGVYAFWKNK
jgi:hypothetical protein